MSLTSVTRTVADPAIRLVLMHGLGSNEQDMLGLADMLHPRVETICLRAPYRYGPGFAWFDIQWGYRGIQIDPDQFWRSVEDTATEIKALQSQNLIVGGFSQGAMMTVGLLDRYPSIMKGAVLLSGRGLNLETPDFTGKIFQAHGAFDDVISPDDAYALKKSLTGLGDQYEFHEYEMGHWVSEEEIEDLNSWLARFIDSI